MTNYLSMNNSYQIRDQTALYFLTFQVINWVDVFTRPRYKDIIVDSLNYSVQNKNLKIYAWVIMSNHVHILAATDYNLSDIVRDLKSYTSKSIINSIIEFPESRRDWMLFQFSLRGKMNKRNSNYQFWAQENHAVQITDATMLNQRINYIHENPVRAGLVISSIYYPYSSAIDYLDGKGLVNISKV